MNTLVLVLSYIVLLLIVAVGYLLWNNRKMNQVTDDTSREVTGLWNRIHKIQDQMERPQRFNPNDPFVPWSAFETAQDRINRLEGLVNDLTRESIQRSLHKVHTNPEDSHAAE